MCGISGIIPLCDMPKDKILEVIKHLLIENRIRGGDATGIASWDNINNKILICKQADEAKEFTPNLTTEHIKGITIGHTRAKTQGDPSNPENNHPMFGEKYCIIHNGTVHSMKRIEGYPYKGECDTEVLLSYIETYGVRDAIPMIDGSASFALMDPGNKMFYLYRHTSPLTLAYYPGVAFVFSSLEFPLKKVGDILGIEKLWDLFLPQYMNDFSEGQLFCINVDTNEIITDNIKIEYKPYNYKGK